MDDLSSKITNATARKMLEKLRKFLHLPTRRVSVEFFHQKEYSLFEFAHEDNSGQYLVRYVNGIFEVLPGEMSGHELKRILGFRILKIQFWAFLPDKYCKSSLEIFGISHRVPSSLLEREFFPYDYVRQVKGSDQGHSISGIESKVSGPGYRKSHRVVCDGNESR